jgi:tRNA threonylcarbamoyladenosine biosynthesis protein TsaB
MNVAIDTAANLCAACVYDPTAGRELGRAVRDIGKGHAEQLMDVIGEAMAAAGTTYADLTAVAVAVGPGSFTGIRVGVATVRGLALALKVPAIGVTTLEALAAEARDLHGVAPAMAAIDAGRDGLYVATYASDGTNVAPPAVLSLDEAKAMVTGDMTVCGSAAARIVGAAEKGRAVPPSGATADIAVYARLAASRSPGEKPKPLYLRAPDARPQAHAILARRPG